MKKLILLFTLLASACLTFASEPKLNLQIEGSLIQRMLNQVPFPYKVVTDLQTNRIAWQGPVNHTK